MNTQTTQTITAFLALPTNAIPSASYLDYEANSYADAWQTLRNAANGGTSEWIDGPIRIRADRDRWRDGVIVEA